VPLDDWDVLQLVAHLDAEGLHLRALPTAKDGLIDDRAFLTTTSVDWDDLNDLRKVPEQIVRWQGSLYCERGPAGADAWADLSHSWATAA